MSDTMVPNEPSTRVSPESTPAPSFPATFREWMLQTYTENDLSDLATYGQQKATLHSMTYLHESVTVYNQYRDDLWKRLNEEVEAQDTDENPLFGPLSLLAAYPSAPYVHQPCDIKEIIVHFTAELVAADIMREREKVAEAC